jgi:hypothetical protein
MTAVFSPGRPSVPFVTTSTPLKAAWIPPIFHPFLACPSIKKGTECIQKGPECIQKGAECFQKERQETTNRMLSGHKIEKDTKKRIKNEGPPKHVGYSVAVSPSGSLIFFLPSADRQS